MSSSFFERGKGFLDKGKCLLGFHQGTWEYRRPSDCAQLMVCQRCTAESSRVEHCWGEWDYRANEACDLVRTCGRCGQTEIAVKHVWGEPRYRSSNACEQVAVCSPVRRAGRPPRPASLRSLALSTRGRLHTG